MKHSLKIILLLLIMFFVTQLIGLVIVNAYTVADDAIPYGFSPPEDISPTTSFISIIFAIGIAVILMLVLMKYRTELFLRLWFFFVIIIAIGIAVNALFMNTSLGQLALYINSFSMQLSALIALAIAIPLAYVKVFQRNLLVHNLTELLIYPGIAVIFVPLLNIWTIVLLFILISVYDMYAVWHSGFMQRMAKYQIQHLKVFSGFFVPYLGKKEREKIKSLPPSKLKKTRLKVNIAILGGGDIVFPIILAGVVLRQMGMLSALMIALGATLALGFLFYISKKGRFYPAMPFISAGCFIALGLAYLL